MGAALAGVVLAVAPAVASAAVPVHVRVVDARANAGGGPLTVIVGGRMLVQGMLSQQVSDYAEVGAGEQNIAVEGPGTATVDADLEAGGYYTLVVTGQPDDPLLVVRETGGGSEQAAAVLHVVRTGAMAYPAEVLLDHGQRISMGLRADADAPAVTVAPGDHELELYSVSGVLLGRVTCHLTAGQEATVVLTGAPGGTPDLQAIVASGPQILSVSQGATQGASPPPTSSQTAAAASPTAAAGVAVASAPTTAASPSAVLGVSATATAAVPAAPSKLPKTGVGPLGLVLSLLYVGAGFGLVRPRVFH